MRPFTPTLNIIETSQNVRSFVHDNKDVFWTILKPLLPWIIGLTLFDLIITVIFFPQSENGFALGNLITGYFYTCLVITWHRVVIHGPENYIAMNPLKPQKHELVFIGMGILLGIASFLAGVIGASTLFIHPAVGFICLISVIIGVAYLGYKFSFYFPAKAVNNSISFKQSYALTTGYFWKLMGAIFWAPIKYIIILVAYFIVAAIIAGFIMVGHNQEIMIIDDVLGFIINLPILSYFYPLLYVFGVTVLSNYYQHAIQNKSISTDDSS